MTEDILDRLVEGLAIVFVVALAFTWLWVMFVFVRWLAGWFA